MIGTRSVSNSRKMRRASGGFLGYDTGGFPMSGRPGSFIESDLKLPWRNAVLGDQDARTSSRYYQSLLKKEKRRPRRSGRSRGAPGPAGEGRDEGGRSRPGDEGPGAVVVMSLMSEA